MLTCAHAFSGERIFTNFRGGVPMDKTQAAMIAADARILAEKANAAVESGTVSEGVQESLRRSFLTLKASCECLTRKRK